MTLDELGIWAARQADGLATKFGLEDDGETFLSRQCIKLGEEAGELQGAVLTFLNYQREHKINDFTTEGLGAEVADVVICAAILDRRRPQRRPHPENREGQPIRVNACGCRELSYPL